MTAITLPAETTAHVEHLRVSMGDRIVNGYRCQKCHRILIVTHRDAGVTPMSLSCQKTPGCFGASYSMGYPAAPVPAEFGAPTHEWYRPEQDEFDALDVPQQDHVRRGGLILREVAS